MTSCRYGRAAAGCPVVVERKHIITSNLKEDKNGRFFLALHRSMTVYWSFLRSGLSFPPRNKKRRNGGLRKRRFQPSDPHIENSPFRTKFERDVEELKGNLGIGCISDYEPQPLLLQSHLGSFAITTIGKINNQEEILEKAYKDGRTHFLEMSGGRSMLRS